MTDGLGKRTAALLALLLAGALLSCAGPGDGGSSDRDAVDDALAASELGEAPRENPARETIVLDVPIPPPIESLAPPLYFGDISLEERVYRYPVIVRARLAGVSGQTIAAGGEEAGKYVNTVRFQLEVGEYLQGSGPDGIVAVWGSSRLHGSQAAARAALQPLLDSRDASHDGREAIFFLGSDFRELFGAASSANAYEIGSADGFGYDDFMSIGSRQIRRWLPADEAGPGTGEGRQYLLAMPGAEPEQALHGRTITLGELRERIAAVGAELSAGDGSEAYLECVRLKFRTESDSLHARSEGRVLTSRASDNAHRTVSGRPAGTVLYSTERRGYHPGRKGNETWLEGGDAALFDIVDGPAARIDVNFDGEFTDIDDLIEYTQSLRARRPLPGGTYAFNIRDAPTNPDVRLCFDVPSHRWTVTVTSPAGVLHEAFFDPAALSGGAVGGAPSPAAFTSAGGAAAALRDIAWQDGKVRAGVSPAGSLSGQLLDFVAPDGRVILTLAAGDATVDGEALAWAVADRPWRDGDELMLRVRGSLPKAAAPGGLAATADGPGGYRLSWRGVSGASGYLIQHRAGPGGEWSAPGERVAGASHAAAGLECGIAHRFRVAAYGGGKRHDPRPGAWAEVAGPAWAGCSGSPAFPTGGYSLTAAAGAAKGTLLGTVAANDPEGDRVSYAIASGNDDGAFALDPGTGRLTVAGPLYRDPGSSRALTVRADDGLGGVGQAVVRIALSSVCRNGVLVPDPGSRPGLVGDCQVLYYGIRQELQGTVDLGWDAGVALSAWPGLRIAGSPPRVAGLRLGERGLDGTLPADLGWLDGLDRINLYENELTGEIPEELGRLGNLRNLLLSDNYLAGEIPEELGGLAALLRLDLAGNELSGEIPPELGRLPGLTHLYLNGNELSGEIPSELGELSALQTLDLGGNSLSGPLPGRLGSLAELTELILNGNSLSGNAPRWLGGLSNLAELWLSGNSFSGPLPRSLGELDLQYLFLSGNSFGGCLAAGLGDVPNSDLGSLGLAYCNRGPGFGAESYEFTVASDAAAGVLVGTVAARDPDPGDSVSYSITAGDRAGRFAIGAGSGRITLAGALGAGAGAPYALTVKAVDGSGGEVVVVVTVGVVG